MAGKAADKKPVKNKDYGLSWIMKWINIMLNEIVKS